MWRRGKVSEDMSVYKCLRNEGRRAIREFYAAREKSLIYAENKSRFFRYINLASD